MSYTQKYANVFESSSIPSLKENSVERDITPSLLSSFVRFTKTNIRCSKKDNSRCDEVPSF